MRAKPAYVAGALFSILLLSASDSVAQGRFEFGFHYGKWSLNLLKPAIEQLADDVAEGIKDEEVDRIQEDYPNLTELGFSNTVEFDSSGHNIGFEARWYPGGHEGVFSIGLAGEKTSMTIGLPSVTTALSLRDQKTGQLYAYASRASSEVTAEPFAVIMTLRWDMFPSHRVNPDFSVGVGAAGVGALDKTTFAYDFSGTLSSPGFGSVTIADATEKTLAQLKVEEDFDYPIGVFPFVQLNLGLKAKVTSSLHLLLDAGVLNGLVLRAGVAVRL